MAVRQIVLDTETTGLDPAQGHRIIEIGGVELIDRKLTGKHFHHYLQPDRDIEEAAFKVHGISNESLQDKPRFAVIVDEFVHFIAGAELVIHNAQFDTGFLDAELARVDKGRIEDICSVLDTLEMARKIYPGQRNGLDALCKRLEVDNARRTLHGALLDAEILADVYLLLTGGQTSLSLAVDQHADPVSGVDVTGQLRPPQPTPVLRASDEEQQAHNAWLDMLEKEGACIWRRQG